jgi:uncharacterized protein
MHGAFPATAKPTYFDRDGRLHVASAPISSAAVGHYVGSRIPRWQQLGLDPDKSYRLLRSPEELRKAASSFRNTLLLSRHADRSEDITALICGALGDVTFDGAYLRAPVTLWTQAAIDGVRSGKARELSIEFDAVVDMTPGVFKGVAYDGSIRHVRGSRVALVEAGHAGPECGITC